MNTILEEHEGISLRQACRIVNISTSVQRYVPKLREDDVRYGSMLRSIADQRPSWGFWKMYHRIRKDGNVVNHKRLYRIYTECRLNIRRKSKRRLPKRIKQPLLQPLAPNLTWSMDFMRDSLFYGSAFRAFNLIDDFNREALNITIAKSITCERVITELDRVIQWRGVPSRIRVDNGPEFIAQALSEYCERPDRAIELVFIQKGKPSQNGYVERFNRTFREDILDRFQFNTINEVQQLSNAWIWDYNNNRPHESLSNHTPVEFLLKYGKLHCPPSSGLLEFPTFQQDEYNNYCSKEQNSIFTTVAKYG